MTVADRVWRRIEEMAVRLAARKSVPSARHAQALIEHILREEQVELPPAHTLSALAQELRRLSM